MGEINWNEESIRWLRDIYEYIAQDSSVAAARTIAGIEQRVQFLASFPELGWRFLESNRHVRIILYGHYRIAYLVHDNGDVTILGVFHTSLDIGRYQL